jgi:activating signal cointegrator complex subunit 1
MGKKKQNGEYNDFIDGEKLRDNAEPRTSLHGASTSQAISPPPGRQDRTASKKHDKGKRGQKNPRLTHFLCLPLVTDSSRPQIEDGLQKLRNDLAQDSVVPPQAVRPPGTLHLTLGVMSLDNDSLSDAIEHLQNLRLHQLLRDLTQRKVAEKAAEDGTISENLNAAAMPDFDGLTINLSALTPMQLPQKTSILYAAPEDPTSRLGAFALKLREDFTREGYIIEDTRPLKLHATILNTIYAKSGGRRGRKSTVKETLKHIEHKVSPHHHTKSSLHDKHDNASAENSDAEANGSQPETDAAKNSGHGPDTSSWLRFDARDLIEKYKDYTWAEDVRIDRVQICKMGAKKILNAEGEVVDEKYEVIAEKGIFE